MIFVSFSIEKIIIPCSYCAPFVPPIPLHIQSNLYLANSLAVSISEPALNSLRTFHVPNLMTFFHCLHHTKVSIQVQGKCSWFATKLVFTVRSCSHLIQPPSWRTTPCQLCVPAYSIYSQLPSLLEALPPSATWGCAKPWWHGPTYHALQISILKIILFHENRTDLYYYIL